MDRRDKIDVELMSNAKWHGTLDSNRAGYFINKMEPPLDFGNDEWDVAVSSVTYEHTWRISNTFDCAVLIVYKAENGRYKGEKIEKDGKTIMQFDCPPNTGDVRQQIMLPVNEHARVWTADWIDMRIPVGDDQGPEYIGNFIADWVNGWVKANDLDAPDALTYKFNKIKNRSEFRGVYHQTYLYLADKHRALARMMGYESRNMLLSESSMMLPLFILDAELPPRFPHTSLLMLYSSIMNEQRCGDASVQLLSLVPVKSKYGDMVHYDVPLPNFKALRLGLSRIEQIDIQVHDHEGKLLEFTGGVTSISLIFRKSVKY